MPDQKLTRDQLIDSIKAKVRIGEGNLRSASVQLHEAKQRLTEFAMTWTRFYSECGLQRSRMYELMAIADGRTSEEQVQAKSRERAAKFAAKNKAARQSVTNGQSVVGGVIKILRSASPMELPLWETFAGERMAERDVAALDTAKRNEACHRRHS
jgi:hypothetical protein